MEPHSLWEQVAAPHRQTVHDWLAGVGFRADILPAGRERSARAVARSAARRHSSRGAVSQRRDDDFRAARRPGAARRVRRLQRLAGRFLQDRSAASVRRYRALRLRHRCRDQGDAPRPRPGAHRRDGVASARSEASLYVEPLRSAVGRGRRSRRADPHAHPHRSLVRAHAEESRSAPKKFAAPSTRSKTTRSTRSST